MGNNFYIASEELLTIVNKLFDEAEKSANERNYLGRQASYIRYLKYVKKDPSIVEKLSALRNDDKNVFRTRKSEKEDKERLIKNIKSVSAEAEREGKCSNEATEAIHLIRGNKRKFYNSQNTLELSEKQMEHIVEHLRNIGTKQEDIDTFIKQVAEQKHKVVKNE